MTPYPWSNEPEDRQPDQDAAEAAAAWRRALKVLVDATEEPEKPGRKP
jgi:hypothetical protein